jgi:hypothetical protein
VSEPKIPPLYEIPQVEIEEVARDLRWEAARCKVYLAADSKDVIDYCFPLNPFDVSEPDLAKIAAEQTALDFIFCRRTPKPLLLPHYVDDLAKYFAVIQNSASRAYEDLEMWNRIRWGLSISSRKPTEEKSDEEEFASLKNNIIRKLAVWLGVDSFGSERFRRILQDLHSVKDVCRENNDPELDQIIAEYKPLHVREISHFLEAQIPPKTSDHKRATRVAASLRDAHAVDWLLHLNARCSELLLTSREGTGEPIPRYIFLYVSSAPKTARLFEFLQRQQWYPVHRIDKNKQRLPYNFHRNREQILLVARAGWRGKGGADRVSANLDEIELISRMVAELKSRMVAELKKGDACADCILEDRGGRDECAWREVCAAIKKVESKTSDVPDLGLMSRLGQYSNLLKAKPRLKDQQLCLAELQDILNTGAIPDLALQRVLDQQSFAATQSLLARRLLGSDGPEPSVSLPEPLFSLTIFPRLCPPYDRVQDLIARYCSLDSTRSEEMRNILLQAMHEFLALDEKQQTPLSKEHELTRLLLHLAFGGDSGYEDVLERSRQLRKSVKVIGSEPYLFLLCSVIASLQLERYVDTHRYVAQALNLHPTDPFLYHVRGVNTFCWRQNPQQSVFCTQDITTCIDDEKKALEKLRETRDVTADRERVIRLRGMILNNLTFMQSYSSKQEFKRIFDLDKARSSFAELVGVIPRDRWALTPRYFHTEAHLEYQLAFAVAASEQRAAHLRNARAAIEQALKFRPRQQSYSSLLRQIEAAIEELPSEHSISS